MPRQNRTSRVLEKAILRATGLKAIDPNMNFGDVCNLQYMTQQIDNLRSKLDTYNTALSAIASARNEIQEMEKNLAELSAKLLLGVAWKYGNDSHEYMMAGGVRKSDRIRKATATRVKAAAAKRKSQNGQTGK